MRNLVFHLTHLFNLSGSDEHLEIELGHVAWCVTLAPCTGSLSYSRSHSIAPTLGTLLLLIGGGTSLLLIKDPSLWSPCPPRPFSPTMRVPMALSPFLFVWLYLFTEGLFSSQKLWGCPLVVLVCRHPPSSTGMCLHFSSFLWWPEIDISLPVSHTSAPLSSGSPTKFPLLVGEKSLGLQFICCKDKDLNYRCHNLQRVSMKYYIIWLLNMLGSLP